MFANEFKHELIRKYVILFGTLFNNVRVSRSDGTNAKAQNFVVPISYGPREKFLAMNLQKPDSKVQAVSLPRMSFEITGFTPDPERRTQKAIQHRETGGSVHEPAPWDIMFDLNVIVKNNIDGTQIVEQILPYFDPKLSISTQLIEGLDRTFDIDVVFTGVDHEDMYEGDFEQKRYVTWTLHFTMKAMFMKPVIPRKLIKIINVSMLAAMDATQGGTHITIQPGLTANGQPTKDISQTIPYIDIEPEDNYDFIVTVTDI